MSVLCICPECGHRYQIAAELAREPVPCPQCGPDGLDEKADRLLTLVLVLVMATGCAALLSAWLAPKLL